jgi:peptidoglycan/xylan/chitin deacetylase (PgdA/CDA1 family)
MKVGQFSCLSQYPKYLMFNRVLFFRHVLREADHPLGADAHSSRLDPRRAAHAGMSWSDALAAPFIRGAFGLAGWSAPARLSILIFHRVHARPDSLFDQETHAVRFEQLMRLVARNFEVLTVGRAAALLARSELPTNALAITFDDGYADNADVALPILQRHGLCATFFISTGFLDGGRMWNDSIIECLRACRQSEIDLSEFGLGRRVLGGAAERVACIEALLAQTKYLDLDQRQAAVERLQRAAGVDRLPTDLMMRSEQVRELHRAGMEIGAHTVNHPIPTSLSAAAAEREIAEGREHLQQIIDAPVDVMAYPNGKPGRDYDSGHVAMVRQLGFKTAVSTAPGVARAGDDLYQLPRFTPWDRSLLKWSARLIANQRATRFDRA